MQYFAGKWYDDADQFPPCSQPPTALSSLEKRLDKRNLTHKILKPLRWGRSGKCVVIRRGINAADKIRVVFTALLAWVHPSWLPLPPRRFWLGLRDALELLCSEGTVLLRLEQGGGSWVAEGLQSLLTLLKSVGLLFVFALIHREEIKYSKSWLTVADSSYRRGQGAQTG